LTLYVVDSNFKKSILESECHTNVTPLGLIMTIQPYALRTYLPLFALWHPRNQVSLPDFCIAKSLVYRRAFDDFPLSTQFFPRPATTRSHMDD